MKRDSLGVQGIECRQSTEYQFAIIKNQFLLNRIFKLPAAFFFVINQKICSRVAYLTLVQIWVLSKRCIFSLDKYFIYFNKDKWI